MATAALQRISACRSKVLLADNHGLFCEGVAALLPERFELVGSVPDGEALLQAAKRLCPGVIVTDLAMPRLNGFEVIRRLRQEGCVAKVIVLTMHAEVEMAIEAFRIGVCGYVLKQSASQELITALDEVVQDRMYLTPQITKDFIVTLAGMVPLSREPSRVIDPVTPVTARQKQVLQLIVEGHTMKEVGKLLNISSRTAEARKYEMMQRLGMKTTAQLVQYAIRYQLVKV